MILEFIRQFPDRGSRETLDYLHPNDDDGTCRTIGFWTVFNETGLFIAVVSSWLAILMAEWKVWMELRLRIIGVLSVLLLLALLTLQHILIEWSVVPFVFGAVEALWLNMILWAGVGFGGVVLLLRVLAKRQAAWFLSNSHSLRSELQWCSFHINIKYHASTLAQRLGLVYRTRAVNGTGDYRRFFGYVTQCADRF